MQVSRVQLIAGGIAVVLLLAAVSKWSGTASPARSSAPSTPRPEIAPLPLGQVRDAPLEVQRAATGLGISSMIFSFYHETGHMLVSELKLPVTGPQEDVVDEFAAFVLTEALKGAPEDEKAGLADIIYAGALYWKLAAAEHEAGGGKFRYYDEHPPDERRFYSILCIATAADPMRFIGRAVKDGVPQERIEKCALEYKTKYAAWDQLMKPHAPGRLARAMGLHKMTLDYGPAGKAEWGAFENIYRQGLIFQPLLAAVGNAIELPEDITVVAKACGEVNAWWSSRDKTITLCHDLFEHETEIFAKALLAGKPRAIDGGVGVGGTPTPNPIPPQPPVPPNAPRSLAGIWSCQLLVNGMVGQERMQLNTDGSFQVQVVTNGQVINAWGRWSVQGTELRADYQGPPGIKTPEMIPFKMTGPNEFQTATATCQRGG